MKLFNSMHNQIEELKTIKDKEVSMYVCGPTVYNHAHIGNARPILVFDTLRKTLEAIGYKVRFVSNYTDVDDKIINKAKELGISEKEVSEQFIEAYNQVRLGLHANMPDACPKVTETMDDIIAFIAQLVEKDYAYAVDGDVYFRVDKIANYGSLSNQQKEDLVVGARIDENTKKENPLDFTLWKETSEGIRWQSPWSIGRPGWHTECVVMIQKEFQQPWIDIHGGGMDLKFPHHENEIAQSQALYQTSIANYWVHNGMLNIDGEKMSKSLGNVIWAKDMMEKIGANVMRWLMLSAHYRAPLNITEESIENARKECDKVLQPLKQAKVKLLMQEAEWDHEYDQEIYDKFIASMCDDLNTPNAYMHVFEATKKLNGSLRKKDADSKEIMHLVNTLEQMLFILGIESDKIEIGEAERKLYQSWEQAKAEKDFASADALRAKLIEKGIL